MPAARRSKGASPSPNKKPRFTLAPPVRSQTNKRMSEMVTFNNVIYLAGQVAEDCEQDIKGQTAQVLASIDKLLAENHSDKTKIIRADIILKNQSDFAGMNEVWEPWIGKFGPTRATIQANLMNEKWLIEIVVMAAMCKDYPEDEEEEAAADETKEDGADKKEDGDDKKMDE